MEEPTRDDWLKAHAEPDIIASRMADVVRNIVRAVAADDPSAAVSRAAEELRFILELVRLCEKPLSLYGVLHDAIEEMQEGISGDRYQDRFLEAAREGMKYLAESSATDNAARGRAGKRLSAFRNAMTYATTVRRGEW